MILLCLGFYNDVIHVIFHLMVEHVSKDVLHCSLVCYTCIIQSKWHNSVAVRLYWYVKCNLFLIFWCHPDLVLAIETIHE